MDLASVLPQFWVLWLGWGGLSAFLAISLYQAPWQSLMRPGKFNFALGSIVALVLLWSLRAGAAPGVALHLLGVSLLVLCFGVWLALWGAAVIAAAVLLNTGGDWLPYGADLLLTVGVAAGVSRGVLAFSERFLPRHLFVFIFVNGFFGAALSVLAVGFVSTLLLAGAEIYRLDFLLGEYLPYFLLLGFAEAWLSGMVLTLLVIYRPDWVATFDAGVYLRRMVE